MKKVWTAVLMVAFSLSAVAQDAPAASEGKMLVASNGSRLAAVYRVTDDGSAQIILNGKMVTVPADTLSVTDGKLMTSLSKAEVRKLR